MAEAAPFTFESVTIATFALIAAVAVLGAIISGMSGFGGGIIIAAFLAPIIGVRALVPVVGLIMLLNNASRVWFYRKALDFRTAKLVVACAAPTAVLGAILYVELNVTVITALLGSVMIGSVPLRRRLANRGIRVTKPGLAVFGGVFGFLNATMVGTGLLVVPVLMGAGLLSQALLATDAAIAIGVNIVKVVVFGSYGILTLELALAAVVVGLCTIPGSWIAAWIVRRTEVRIHTLLMEGLIVLGGLSFFWRFGAMMGWY
ncbi:MAG: sulfite exporter TauE/SafE family protein [Alphaproteobacteria bacterium]|nr:sulfite exporter TauE/SafE family protein [Alphaproteobacteria bacterium]